MKIDAPEFRTPAGDTFNLNLFVRTTLDGVTGDIDLPASYAARSYPMALGQKIETLIAARLRRELTHIERALLHMALVGEWRRRQEAEGNAADAETRRARSEWLADFQDASS